MRFSVLGPLEVVDDDGTLVNLGGPRQRAVLAALLVVPGRTIQTAAMVEAVWPRNQPARPRRAAQTSIARLRALLGSDRIVSCGGGYAVIAEPHELDALLLEQAACGLADPAEALALWRGDPFPELAEWVCAQANAARLNELHATVAAATLASHIASDHCELAAALARQLLHENPFDERFWLGLIRALHLGGRNAEAVTVCQDARAQLAEQRGLDASEALRSLETAVLCHQVDAVRGNLVSAPTWPQLAAV